MRSLTKFDSVFSPILSQFTQVSPLDKLENEFVQRMVTLVQVESNALIKSLKSATSEEDIDKARWNLLPRMQQLLWYLWRDGWALGKDSALKDLRMAGFSVGDDWAEFAFQSDNSAGNRRSQRDRISDLKTPLEDSRVKKAIEDRTLELSGDFEQNTKDEIKNAFRDFNKDKDKEGARARLEERIARAIGANDGQDERKVRKTAARAKRIARTELTGAYNTARVDSFVSAGVRKFIWITDVRETTCEICLPRNRVVYDISEIPSNPPPVHPYCFTEKTKILMEDGSEKNIANISIGDRVVTATASRVQSVYNTFKTKYIGQILEIELSDGRKIETTPEHPFWDGNLFIPASDIKRGQNLWVYGAVVREKPEVNDLLALQKKNTNGTFLLKNKCKISDDAKSYEVSLFTTAGKRAVDWGFEGETRIFQAHLSRYQDSRYREEKVRHTHSSFQGLTSLRVIGIKQKYFDGYVYNFSVENDEVYIANGILVHNCGCTLQPIQEDDPRVKKAKNLAGAIAPIAAGWLFGKAADKVGAAIDAIPEKEEKENDLWKKVLLAGGAALGLAGIYYLVTRNPNVKQAAQKGVKEGIEEVADQVEAYQQRRRAAEGLSEEKQPSILEQGTVTAASLPPEIRNSLPPGLANSNADIRNIQASEIARRTGLSPKEAERIKLQLEGFLADNPINPEGKTVGNMTVKELKELGLTTKQITELKRRKNKGKLFVTIDDLKDIPGIGDRKVEQMKRRMEEKDNPSLVVNGRRIDDLSIKELKENLGLKQNQALAVKEYLRKNRITKVEDLKNVPGIGKAAVGRAAYRMAMVRPRANINNFSDMGVKLLSERTGLSEKVSQAIIDERKENGDFTDMDDLINRVENRLVSSGVRKKRLGKLTRNKIEENLTVLPEGEEIQPLDLAPKQELKPLPTKNRPIGQRKQEPLPDVRPPKTIARRLSPEERVNAAALEDERQYRELANEVRAYHTIPGTSRKITKQVKQRIEQNASVVARQQEAYRTANSAVSNAVNRIDGIENDVAKLEEAYRTGQNIEEAKKAYLEAIARTEGELDAAGRVLSNANELDTAIERTNRVRTAAEQSIANNANRKARQEALDAKLKAARVDTTDLESDLQRDRTLESIDNQITQLDRLSAVIREDPNNIRGNIQNSKARLEELKNRVNQASEQRASLKQQYQQRFSVLQQEINDVEAQISEVKTQLNFAEKKVQRYRVETARLRRDTSADPSAIAKAERELNRWETTKDSTSRELRSLNRRLTNLKKQRKTNKDTRGYSSGGKLAMFVSNMRRGL